MIDWLKSVWGGKLVHIIGIAIALAAAVVADVNLPSTSHAAIWIPFGLALLTEAGAIFGKVDLSALNPKIVNLALGGLTALSAYLTSNPAGSSWRYAPIALAIVFSIRKALGGVVAVPPKVVILALCGSLALGGAVACAPVVAALPVVIAAVQGAELAINMIEAFVADYYKTRPNPEHEKICGEAIAKSRVALAAVLDVANGAGAIDQAQLDVAFKDFEAAYNELTSLVGPLGVHVGSGLHATPGGGLMVPSAHDIVRAGTRR